MLTLLLYMEMEMAHPWPLSKAFLIASLRGLEEIVSAPIARATIAITTI